ncbi:MAG: pilus assembly protein PilP [Acidobacteria bacterium]|nr:pilus assembly protein PilP [Acidobacteriota bacterium]
MLKRSKISLILFIVLLFTLSSVLLIAQEDKKDKDKKKKDESKSVITETDSGTDDSAAEDSAEPIEDLTKGTAEVWNPKNRREPFSDPVQKAKTASAGDTRVLTKEGKRPAGIEGMDLKELEIVGILFIKGSYKAMCIGSDDQPYTLNQGQEIWDSRVKEIDMNCVTFEQETEDIRFLVRRMRTVRRCLENEK